MFQNLTQVVEIDVKNNTYMINKHENAFSHYGKTENILEWQLDVPNIWSNIVTQE